MTILSEVLQGLFIAALVVTGVTFIVGITKFFRTDTEGGGWLLVALCSWFAGVIIDVIGMTLFG